MDNTAAAQWEACLQLIRTQLPATEYNTWFEPLAFVGFKSGRLTVSVPTKYVGDYIREHHRELVSRALAQCFDADTQLIWRNEEVVAQWREEEKRRREADHSPSQKQAPPLDSRLNSRFTFDTFVEGQSNKLARAVALSIAEKPGQTTFNPFFLYGPSGVGKTHLVNALGIRLKELYPEKRVLFVSAHLFKTQYTDSIIHNTSNDFINFYQSIDVLIIDDIQEITTAKTQMAFFHIFNHLQQNKRQIVITCDRPPVLFEGIEERMLTRFKWGMVAELEKPDTQLRRDILTAKIRRDGLSFPVEVVDYIAQNVDSSVRELEGIINGIMAYSVVDDCDIDIDLARRVVARIVNLERKELTAEGILTAVSRHSGVSRRDLCAKSRKQGVVAVRELAMYLCHKYRGQSYAQIGRIIGGRDHSTVLHGCNQVSRRLQTDRDFRRSIEELEAALRK